MYIYSLVTNYYFMHLALLHQVHVAVTTSSLQLNECYCWFEGNRGLYNAPEQTVIRSHNTRTQSSNPPKRLLLLLLDCVFIFSSSVLLINTIFPESSYRNHWMMKCNRYRISSRRTLIHTTDIHESRLSKLFIQHWIKCIQVQSSGFPQRYNTYSYTPSRISSHSTRP